MPQVLPYVQSPLEQLMPHINEALGQVGQGLQQRSAMKELQEIENQSRQSQQNSDSKGSNPQSTLTDLQIAQAARAAKKVGLDPNIYGRALIEKRKTQDKETSDLRKIQSEFDLYEKHAQQQAKPLKTEKPLEYEGYQFSPEESQLLERPKAIPAVGPLASQAKIEATDRNRAEDKTNKFMEKFPDLNKSQTDLNKLYQAKKIIEEMPDDLMRKLVQAKLEGRGLDQMAQIFKSPEQQKLFYLLRPYLETKEIGGSNPSTKEVLLAMSSLPSGLNTKEANKYIINQMINDKEGQNKLLKFYNYATSKNPYIAPNDLQSLGKKVTSPKPIEKVAPGTFLSVDKARELVMEYGSLDEAKKAATEAGYEPNW